MDYLFANLFHGVVVSILSLIGLGIVLHIIKKKNIKKDKILCPLNGECDYVMHSKYAKFLGIKLEYYGLIYYGMIFISYCVMLFFPQYFDVVLGNRWLLCLVSISYAGLLMSFYLTAVQGIILKKWCTFCIMSAILSTLIFLVSVAGFPGDIYLSMLAIAPGMIFALALTAGFGIAIGASVIVMLREFLKDNVFSDKEKSVIDLNMNMLWLAYGVAFILFSGLYIASRLSPNIVFVKISAIFFAISLLANIISGLVFIPRADDILKNIGEGKTKNGVSRAILIGKAVKYITVGLIFKFIAVVAWGFVFYMVLAPALGFHAISGTTPSSLGASFFAIVVVGAIFIITTGARASERR